MYTYSANSTPYRQALKTAWDWAKRAEGFALGPDRDDAQKMAAVWAGIAKAEGGGNNG